MCGLFGFAGKFSDKNTGATLLRALAVANQSRGLHSTGLALCSAKRGPVVAKRAVAPVVAVASKWFRNAVNDVGYDVAIGHTRWATHGAVTAANAHPFSMGDVCGAHNGVCNNHDELASAAGLPKRDVDSQTLIDLIARDTTLDPAKMLGNARGKLNLTWVDTRNGLAVTLLTAGNPLHYCEVMSEGRKVVVWSSEQEHLERAVAIAGLRRHADATFKLENYSYLTVRRAAAGMESEYFKIKPSDASFTCFTSGAAATYGSYRGSYDDENYDVRYAHDAAGDKVEPRYRVGDIVECIEPFGANRLVRGRTYRCTSIQHTRGEWFGSFVPEHKAIEYQWELAKLRPSRFDLVRVDSEVDESRRRSPGVRSTKGGRLVAIEDRYGLRRGEVVDVSHELHGANGKEYWVDGQWVPASAFRLEV